MFSYFICPFLIFSMALCGYCSHSEGKTEEVFVVEKKGVIHKFSKEDIENEYFVTHDFPTWENETFDVFDLVKDDQGIAIDIGAWIGTTAIWLSKNFHHVIAVEADRGSLESITKNLQVSECQNVTLCPFPVAGNREEIIFGPRGPRLNDSMACIKTESNSPLDYSVKSLTFKQIVFDYIYSNESISSKKIAFIKCDIEGGEENILEDVLHFAYYNKVPVYMSFHMEWWKSKKISDFEYLFKYFTNNCPDGNVCSFLRFNPFGSILFEPKDNEGALTKNNITAVIISYNQPTYTKNMVRQLEKFTSDIVIIDNNSSSESLTNYYENEYKHTLLKLSSNFGYTVYKKDFIQKLLGDTYILTDPDLEFNPNLPDHFIQNLIDISNRFESKRVGFALLIDADDIRTDITFLGESVKAWESTFWQNKLFYPPNPSLELYEADIDTTFCFINRRFGNPAIRVAGDYTAKHLPWHTNFRSLLEEGEYENYLKNNISTNWLKKAPTESEN